MKQRITLTLIDARDPDRPPRIESRSYADRSAYLAALDQLDAVQARRIERTVTTVTLRPHAEPS